MSASTIPQDHHRRGSARPGGRPGRDHRGRRQRVHRPGPVSAAPRGDRLRRGIGRRLPGPVRAVPRPPGLRPQPRRRQVHQLDLRGAGLRGLRATAGPDALIVNGSYNHTLNGATLHLIALSNDRLAFSGTGYYNPGPYTWTIRGQIIGGNKVKATIVYNTGYKMVMTGAIASDGSAAGTAVSNTSPPQALTWTMPAGSFFSVLSYSARVQSDQIAGRNATFTFTIPNSVPGLAGIKVTDKVHDGGFGPRHDRFAQDSASWNRSSAAPASPCGNRTP